MKIVDILDLCKGLIGKPWLSGARGPEAFDCWGLLVWFYAEALNTKLPDYPGIDAKNPLAVTRKIEAGVCDWQRLSGPKPFCAVGMSAGGRLHHVGLWLELEGMRGILHAAEGRGVVFQSRASLRTGGTTVFTFYELKT